MNWEYKTIKELVEKNYQFANFLYRCGIDFDDYPHKTPQQLYKEKGINFQQTHQYFSQNNKVVFPEIYQMLKKHSLEWVLKYLQNSHNIFLKERMPYMAHLLEKNIDTYPNIKDLKLLFPLFTEEFILHIHEEEEGVFQYLSLLSKAQYDKNLWGKAYLQMQEEPLEKFLAEHHNSDDEMRGIREFTQDYFLPPSASLSIKVIYSELQSFERELQLHAQIEDEILIPKAIVLEKDLKTQMKSLSTLN